MLGQGGGGLGYFLPTAAPPLPRPSPLWEASVSLTPTAGSGMRLGLILAHSSGLWAQQLPAASRATRAWKDNYHQHAISDEGLRWGGAERQNENSGQLGASWLIAHKGDEEPE